MSTVGIIGSVTPELRVALPEPDYENYENLRAKASELKVSLADADMTDEQKKEFELFLGLHRGVFAVDMSEIGRTHLFSHKINTGDHSPVYQRAYP